LLIAALCAALGLFVSGYIANLCVSWYHISKMEGGAGYFVIFMAALGAVIALVLGLVMSRIAASAIGPKFLVAGGMSLGSVFVVGGVVLLVAWWRADFAPLVDGQRLALAIEVRGPARFRVPFTLDQYGAFATVYATNGRTQPNTKLDLDHARQENGRWIVPAVVALNTSAARKSVRAYFHDKEDVIFPLPLRAHPNRSDFEWRDWVESDWATGKGRPAPEDKFELRYRVQMVNAANDTSHSAK
jgi:hypothetical protein